MSRYCSQCGKSRKACICAWIESLTPNVELVILQHPSEQHRPLGTARILSLSLTNCRCLVGEDFSADDALNQLLSDADVDHYVLYPNEHSRLVSDVFANRAAWQRASHGAPLLRARKIRVFLLDGTWKKAYKMWQLASNLHALPSLHLPDDLKGDYRIRKAPTDNSLSTVEAGYHLLQLLEPEQDFSALLRTFERMIEFQIAQMPAGVYHSNYAQKPQT